MIDYRRGIQYMVKNIRSEEILRKVYYSIREIYFKG